MIELLLAITGILFAPLVLAVLSRVRRCGGVGWGVCGGWSFCCQWSVVRLSGDLSRNCMLPDNGPTDHGRRLALKSVFSSYIKSLRSLTPFSILFWLFLLTAISLPFDLFTNTLGITAASLLGPIILDRRKQERSYFAVSVTHDEKNPLQIEMREGKSHTFDHDKKYWTIGDDSSTRQAAIKVVAALQAVWPGELSLNSFETLLQMPLDYKTKNFIHHMIELRSQDWEFFEDAKVELFAIEEGGENILTLGVRNEDVKFKGRGYFVTVNLNEDSDIEHSAFADLSQGWKEILRNEAGDFDLILRDMHPEQPNHHLIRYGWRLLENKLFVGLSPYTSSKAKYAHLQSRNGRTHETIFIYSFRKNASQPS